MQHISLGLGLVICKKKEIERRLLYKIKTEFSPQF